MLYTLIYGAVQLFFGAPLCITWVLSPRATRNDIALWSIAMAYNCCLDWRGFSSHSLQKFVTSFKQTIALARLSIYKKWHIILNTKTDFRRLTEAISTTGSFFWDEQLFSVACKTSMAPSVVYPLTVPTTADSLWSLRAQPSAMSSMKTKKIWLGSKLYHKMLIMPITACKHYWKNAQFVNIF